MTPLAMAGAATLGAWVAYSWGAHLITPACVWRGSGRQRRIALTFDDGPDHTWTPRILDVLADKEVLGTFFLVGERAARAPGTVRAIAASGHEVGNHSWSHRNLWFCGPRATDAEVGRAHDLLADLTGEAPRHFRPPWGIVNAATFGAVRRRGARCVFWSIQPEGLRPRPAATQVEDVLRRARPGAIVDLHDAEGTSEAPARLLAALPAMIDGLREAGFGFATVADLLAATSGKQPPSLSS